MPTFEGLFFALLIVSYERSSFSLPRSLSRFLAWIGCCSYSYYLLHFLYVHEVSAWIDGSIGSLSRPTTAVLLGTLAFAAFLPVAGLGYRCIEKPFLRWYRPYRRDRNKQDFAADTRRLETVPT